MAEIKNAYGWNPDMPLPLQVKLKEDLKQAMRDKDEAGRNTIRQVMSEFFKLTVPVTLEAARSRRGPSRPRRSPTTTSSASSRA